MGKLLGFFLLLAALSFALAQDSPKYVKKGGKLTLDLRPAPSEPITNILWKFKGNLLAEWVKDIVPEGFYSTFKGRSTLDTATGRLIIDNMSKDDTGEFTVEVNNKVQSESYNVQVIEEVSKPEVVVKPLVCGPTTEQCKLTCQTGTTEAELVTYSWKKDDGVWTESGHELNITKARDSSVKTFTCQAKNPLGSKDSDQKTNPIFKEKELDPNAGNGGMVAGIIIAVLVLLGGAGGLGTAWKLKKGPFKNRGTDSLDLAENGGARKDGPPSSPQPTSPPTDNSNNSAKPEEEPLKSNQEPKEGEE